MTDDSKRRPGDVPFANWRNGRGLAMGNLPFSSLFAKFTPSAKSTSDTMLDSKARYEFAAMVFETSGAVNSEGNDIIKQLIRFASKRECVGNSSFVGPYFLLSPVADMFIDLRFWVLSRHSQKTL